MRYFYESKNCNKNPGEIYTCDHPLFNRCTLFTDGDLGLAVIQQRFNPKLKISWWDSIDSGLANDIFENDGFRDYFNSHASKAGTDGLYFTVKVRKLMWALRMKPLKREFWEE